MDFIAVSFEKLHNITGIDEYCRCVVARMDPHDLILIVLINKYDNILVIIIKNAERRDRPSVQSHFAHQILLGSKCQRARIMLFSEFFEVDFLIFKACDQLVFPFLVIPYEEILGYHIRMRQLAVKHLVYSEYSLMFNHFVLDLFVIEKFHNVFFAQCHLIYPPRLIS